MTEATHVAIVVGVVFALRAARASHVLAIVDRLAVGTGSVARAVAPVSKKYNMLSPQRSRLQI